MRKNTLILCLSLLAGFSLSACSNSHTLNTGLFGSTGSVARDTAKGAQIEDPEFWQGNITTVWGKLQQVPYTKLLANETIPDHNAGAWIKLAMIAKSDSTDTTQLVHHLEEWRALNPDHEANALFPDNGTLNNLTTQAPPKNIVVMVPLQGPFAPLGNAVRNGYLNAYFAELAKTSQQQTITFYDTNSQTDLIALYQKAESQGADMIIGPLTKENVKKITDYGHFTHPTLLLNYTDLWYGALPTNLYQFGLSPIDEAKQIADKAWQSGHSHALVITVNDEWGQHVLKSLNAEWQANGGTVVDTYYVTPTADLSKDIPKLLHINTKEDQERSHDATENSKDALEKQRRQDFDVIFLLVPPDKARSIVPMLRFYYVTSTPIYATSLIYEGKPQPTKDTDLNGVFFCDIPALLQAPTNSDNPRLFAVGQDAYLISLNLNRFLELPNFPAYGATGALSLDARHQFYRRLAWAQFHDGQP